MGMVWRGIDRGWLVDWVFWLVFCGFSCCVRIELEREMESKENDNVNRTRCDSAAY